MFSGPKVYWLFIYFYFFVRIFFPVPFEQLQWMIAKFPNVYELMLFKQITKTLVNYSTNSSTWSSSYISQLTQNKYLYKEYRCSFHTCDRRKKLCFLSKFITGSHTCCILSAGVYRGIDDWKVMCLVFQGASCGRERRPCQMWSPWKWWIFLLQEHRLSWRESLAKRLVNVPLTNVHDVLFRVKHLKSWTVAKRPCLLLDVPFTNTNNYFKKITFCKCNCVYVFHKIFDLFDSMLIFFWNLLHFYFCLICNAALGFSHSR